LIKRHYTETVFRTGMFFGVFVFIYLAYRTKTKLKNYWRGICGIRFGGFVFWYAMAYSKCHDQYILCETKLLD